MSIHQDKEKSCRTNNEEDENETVNGDDLGFITATPSLTTSSPKVDTNTYIVPLSGVCGAPSEPSSSSEEQQRRRRT